MFRNINKAAVFILLYAGVILTAAPPLYAVMDGKIFYHSGTGSPTLRYLVDDSTEALPSIIDSGDTAPGLPRSYYVVRENPYSDEYMLGIMGSWTGTGFADQGVRFMQFDGNQWNVKGAIGGREDIGDIAEGVGWAESIRAFDFGYYQDDAADERALAAFRRSNILEYRVWSGALNEWIDHGELHDIGEIPRWVRVQPQPGSNYMAVAYSHRVDGDGDPHRVNLLIWDGDNSEILGSTVSLASQSGGRDGQSFDISFELESGRLMVAWVENDTNTVSGAGIYYSTWTAEDGWADHKRISAGVFASEEIVNQTNQHLILRSRPETNEIILAFSNGDQDLYAAVWNGSEWEYTHKAEWAVNISPPPNVFDIAFEGNTNNAILAYRRRATNRFAYVIQEPGSAWGDDIDPDVGWNWGGRPYWINLYSTVDNNIVLLGLEGTSDPLALGVNYWDGEEWSNIRSVLNDDAYAGAPGYTMIMFERPPWPVDDLSAEPLEDGDINLTWSARESLTGAQYRIRWSTVDYSAEEWLSDWEETEGEWEDYDNRYSATFPVNTNAGEYHLRTSTGLDGGVTYYFRIWVADDEDNWSDISNSTSATVVEIISISAPPAAMNFGEVAVGASFISTDSLNLINTGNVSKRYSIYISSVVHTDNSSSFWVSTNTTAGYNRFILSALFHGTRPEAGYFESPQENALLYDQPRTAAETIFTYEDPSQQKGYNVPKGEEVNLWLKLDMPTALTTSRANRISIRISAEKQP